MNEELKKQILELIKESLTVKLYVESNDANKVAVEVQLILGTEVIADDCYSCYIETGDNYY